MSLKNKLVHTFGKYVNVTATDPSFSLSSSSKSSKKKWNKTTGSIVKTNIKAFERTSIEGHASRNQRSWVVNISRVSQHIWQPPVARLSKNDDNASSTACIDVLFRICPPRTDILVTTSSKSIYGESNNDFDDSNSVDTTYSDDNKKDLPHINTKTTISQSLNSDSDTVVLRVSNRLAYVQPLVIFKAESY